MSCDCESKTPANGIAGASHFRACNCAIMDSPSRMMLAMPTTTVRPVARESDVPPICLVMNKAISSCHHKRSQR